MTFAIVGGGQLDTGYTIDNSLRFNSADSADLTFTLGTPTSQRKFTESFWVKRGLTGGQRLFKGAGTDNVNKLYYGFNTDQLNFTNTESGGVNNLFLKPNAYYRDYGAWYHLVLSVDTTQATASDRAKVYVNGEQVTDFATALYPPLNHDFVYYANGTQIQIGDGYHATVFFYDGYMAEINFIDGQALDPTDFGEFDANSGIWKPIEYTGTYGNNGYYLDFEDSGSLGADQSGNGNNFTPNNLAATDQTTDTPTNNFATCNPIMKSTSDVVLSEGNLKVVSNYASGWQHSGTTFAVKTGKWYWEAKATVVSASDKTSIGVVQFDTSQVDFVGNTNTDRSANGISGHGAGTGGYTYVQGDIIMCAMDITNNTVYWGKNGTWYGTLDPAAGTGSTKQTVDNSNYCMPIVGGYGGSTWELNFGHPQFSISSGNTDDNGYGNFEYAPPSGYLALCTQNLATELSPTIDDGSEYFNTVLWTGNGTANRDITGVGFQPDFLWIKSRSLSGNNHHLFNSSVGMPNHLSSDLDIAEATATNKATAFLSDGFTIQTHSSVNQSSATYVAWNWLVNGGTTSSNTDGSITSTVQANPTAGFSIVTYTGTGANATIGHGLGKVPAMIITKTRDNADNWGVYHQRVDSTAPEDYYLPLNLTNGKINVSTTWNDTAPTSSVFSVGSNGVSNDSGGMIAYCFAEIEGYSKFGSYTGNGANDGPFVYTGFKPAWLITKRTDSTSNWVMHDNTRDPLNESLSNNNGSNARKNLYANLDLSEDSSRGVNFYSNGFKVEAASSDVNGSGATYIYMAFAENPFVSSAGVPVTAR